MTEMIKPMLALLPPAEERALREDEYWDKYQNLIICSQCHSPRQVRLHLPGKDMDQIQRMKTEGLQDRYLQDFTFSNNEGFNPTEIGYAKQYVANWKTMLYKNKGLLLWGDVGTGKTFIAGCIANALIAQCVPVLMTNFPRILNALASLRDLDRNQYVDSLNKYRLLILDDLGVGRSTDYAREQLFHVIDSRCRSRKPMLITTNLSLDELKNTADPDLHRIYDRILAQCIPVKVNNANIRRLKTDSEFDEMRGLLSACG